MKELRKSDIKGDLVVGSKINFCFQGKFIERVLRKDTEGFYIKFNNQHVRITLDSKDLNQSNVVDELVICSNEQNENHEKFVQNNLYKPFLIVEQVFREKSHDIMTTVDCPVSNLLQNQLSMKSAIYLFEVPP